MHAVLRRAALIATVAGALAPAAAHAHVTLKPDRAPAGSFTRLDVRVPNERDRASTRKVAVKFPPGFIFISHERVPGWTTKVEMAKLAEPVELYGEKRTEQVDTVTFSTKGSGIGPGEFRDFGLSVGLPDKPGRKLTFKSLQTYSNDEVVRWIGPPDADEPAPQVELLPAGTESAAGANEPPEATSAAAAAASGGGGGSGSGGGGTDGLAVAALVVGGLGLATGAAGLTTARRMRPAA